MDTATKTGLNAEKTAYKKAVHKTAVATKELIGKKLLKKCEFKTCASWAFKKCWRNSYSTGEKTRNTKRVKVGFIKWNTTNIWIIERFKCVLVSDKKMYHNKWFVEWPFFCQQEHKI